MFEYAFLRSRCWRTWRKGTSGPRLAVQVNTKVTQSVIAVNCDTVNGRARTVSIWPKCAQRARSPAY